MAQLDFIWDLEDDPEGNYWHICIEGHGISREEVEEVIESGYPAEAISHSSGRPLVFGWTVQGRYIAVVYDDVPGEVSTVYPVTAYETPPPSTRRRRRRKQ